MHMSIATSSKFTNFEYHVLITTMGAEMPSRLSRCSNNECKLLFLLLHMGRQVVRCIIQMDKRAINDWHAFEDVL